ncbi:proline dehydrogenase family protein [Spiractinospora alimapuensis]|uniref:proline dehydrogenase family protein n=1 Tax=Spiractinospora alimapuensis TaxID=2820884 RepID=UPI001F439AE0|nr:proline dehydrogenase family protein [Spiractinospora alimapuensis]QVQ54543.1 proline dehydrogenase family protein [Spiractinospora alimapuensis]
MTERLAIRAASRYVAGTTLDHAVAVVGRLSATGVASSVDMFGEWVRDASTVDRVRDDYLALAGRLADLPANTWISIDLSHLGLDIDPARCADYLTAITRAVPTGHRVQVGAEDARRADAVLDCVTATAAAGLGDRLGATVQANLRRSPRDVERLVDAGVHVRLVKGAFVEPASDALSYGEETDIAYLRLAHRLAERGAEFCLATHDGVVREALLAGLGPLPVEQLLGVRPEIRDDLVERGIPVRVYVPYGPDWFRYWMRRVAESRGA